jgi:phosphonate transport system ATP-binding protein
VYDGPSNALTAAMLRELYGAEADDILSTSSISAAQPSVPVAGEFHALPAFAAAAA